MKNRNRESAAPRGRRRQGALVLIAAGAAMSCFFALGREPAARPAVTMERVQRQVDEKLRARPEEGERIPPPSPDSEAHVREHGRDPSEDAPDSLPDFAAAPAGPVDRAVSRDETSLTGLMLLEPDDLRRVLSTANDPAAAQAAAWAIGNRQSVSDADVSALLERLARSGEEDVALRKTLLWALSSRPDRLPVGLAAEWAVHQESQDVRRAALRSLVAVTGERATEAMRAVALGDAEPRNRLEGITLLTLRLSAREAVDQAVAALRLELHPDVRARWLNLAGVHDTPESDGLLRTALYSAQESIEARAMAAEMLATRSPSAATMLASDPLVPAQIRDRIRAMTAGGPAAPAGLPR